MGLDEWRDAKQLSDWRQLGVNWRGVFLGIKWRNTQEKSLQSIMSRLNKIICCIPLLIIFSWSTLSLPSHNSVCDWASRGTTVDHDLLSRSSALGCIWGFQHQGQKQCLILHLFQHQGQSKLKLHVCYCGPLVAQHCNDKNQAKRFGFIMESVWIFLQNTSKVNSP